MGFRTTLQADDDIIGIYLEGYRSFGRVQAERYQEALANTFVTIAHNPHIARDRREFGPPVRLHPYNAHLIVYRIVDDGILIVRVLNGRQD